MWFTSVTTLSEEVVEQLHNRYDVEVRVVKNSYEVELIRWKAFAILIAFRVITVTICW